MERFRKGKHNHQCSRFKIQDLSAEITEIQDSSTEITTAEDKKEGSIMKSTEEERPPISHSEHEMAAHLQAAVFCPTLGGDLIPSSLSQRYGISHNYHRRKL